MSIERTIYLLIIGFLLVVSVAAGWSWYSHQKSCAKPLKRTPFKEYPPYDAKLEREDAHKIFKGTERQKALEAIAFVEKERSELLRDEAALQEHDSQSRRNAFQLAILMGLAITLGIAYGLYKFANAP